MLNQQKFGWPNKVFRLNMGQWKFLLIEQNIFLGVCLYAYVLDELPYIPVERSWEFRLTYMNENHPNYLNINYNMHKYA